jgi:hypothetical protein
MYRLEATEVELDCFTVDCFTVDSIDFDIWKFGQYLTTALTLEEKR